ncbi:50S ribosomal protein L14 [Candidatus Vidania fulgoroideorum]
MIQEGTILNNIDNTGVKNVKCIKVLHGSKKKYAYIGDIIKVCVKKCNSKSKIKKGEVHNALVVNTKYGIFRNPYFLKFNNNSCIILNDNMEILGSRIFGIIPREINKNITNIFNHCSYVI